MEETEAYLAFEEQCPVILKADFALGFRSPIYCDRFYAVQQTIERDGRRRRLCIAEDEMTNSHYTAEAADFRLATKAEQEKRKALA